MWNSLSQAHEFYSDLLFQKKNKKLSIKSLKLWEKHDNLNEDSNSIISVYNY